ncbi:CinA family protein [Pigmentiphaga aceris]|uniref:CinA family protein n=1 Tax=Pigmentiphaga aceris TaxID=1940612 RepID=A0A5C0B7C1_9BURK|nr:CinA family protein [Pigmentiphaga aceris]QEI08647.1 CinA family protein [Pigmentiphaga aceris]
MDKIEAVVEFMKARELVLTTAESCTGGLISSLLVDMPGAGSVLACAFVVYSPQAKQHMLGVSPETLANFNLTSEPVATEMALGALTRCEANLAVSNTGVADCTDDDIPAGTQCFAWAFQAGEGVAPTVFAETRRFSGDRNTIRDAAARYALARIPHYHRKFSEEACPNEQSAD